MTASNSRITFCCLLAILVLACGPGDSASAPEPAASADAAEDPGTPSVPSVVEIKATDYAFTAPPTFPSGWVTLRFDNQGEETHFLVLWRLPEGHTFDEFASQVSRPFGELYVEYRAGLDQQEFFDQLVAVLPDWFYEAVRMGGPGFTAPGRVSQTTVFLEPGDYVMECYVRTRKEPDTFHGGQGMLRPLIVTEAATGEEPPSADLEITLSNYEMIISGEPAVGEQTIKVRAEEAPEGLILHNVHLARLDGDTTGEDLAVWLDWVDQMLPPAPAEFLGGSGQLPPGAESYFTVDLEPGRYAWVSETWGAEGMFAEFVLE